MTRPQGSLQYDNRGRVVLVTGGANGIGRAICESWLQSGAAVVCMDIDAAAAESLPEGILFVRGNTAERSDCDNAVAFACDSCGGLDVLINNAAIQPRDSYLPQHEYSTELWDRLVAVNLTGYAQMAGSALKVMVEQGSGVVCNICSAQGHRTARQVAAYGPIKAANLLQARQWGVEYARRGIRCVSISPGAVMTPMIRATLAEQGGAPLAALAAAEGEFAEAQEEWLSHLARPDAASALVVATPWPVYRDVDGAATLARMARQIGRAHV